MCDKVISNEKGAVRNLCDKVISNEKGAIKGREIFGLNDTQIYQMSDLLLKAEMSGLCFLDSESDKLT